MRLVCGLCFAVLLSLPLFAQSDGRVSGTVVDSSGAAVPNAEVALYLAGGKKPLLTTKSSTDGSYNFIAVRPAYYDLTASSAGFLTVAVHNLTVDPARETNVPQIKLQIASVTQSVDVSAAAEGVEVSNAEVTQTISMEEIKNIPLLDRDPLGILQTQAGVVSNGNSTTVINGLRTSFSDLTVDGINVQDNYIRDNALDYSPNKMLLSQVRQVTIVSTNGNASMSGGATETAFITPSGGNQYHGELFWENRNNAFSANDWFNNQAGVPLPFLNQNQFGANVGGPIKKDKLFFYGAYEAVRAHQQTGVDTQILTASARTGLFKYTDRTGAVRSVNLLTLRGATIDPVMAGILAQVPGPQFINNSEIGDNLNTGGYRFNQRDNETRDNITARIDYSINTKQALSGSFSWNRDNSDRPDAENDYSLAPKVYNPTNAKLLALSWRWTPSARLTNEVRAGFNLTYSYFLTSQNFNGALITGTAFSDPVNEFLPQGRNTNTYVLSDEAGYDRGRHYITFGFHGQKVYVRSYDAAGIVPTYTLGMGNGQPALTTKDLPGGISSTDLADANALLATLGGYLDGYSQSFNVTSRTSGFVPGAANIRHLRMNDYAWFVSDKWRIAQRLTLTAGLRYDLPSVVDERDSLELLPVLKGSAVSTLLSNATLDFAGSSVGRPMYNRKLNNFAPNIGMAWDVFGNGKTSVRAGYSIFYVNDSALRSVENMADANSGLLGLSTNTGLSDRTSALPPIPVPTYQVPTTVAAQFANNPFNTVGMVDPNLRRPYVQQYSVGIQREIKGTVYEARYVGNHTVGAYRAFDFNQVNINAGGFLQDFLRAQKNGFLALNAFPNRGFLPAYNSSIAGSQPLTVFPLIGSRGALTNGDVINLIETGQVGELATYYQVNGYNTANAVPFFKNPYALGTDMLTNYSSASYNALQLEARHRTRSGLNVQANYTWSKVLSDADGDSQTRLQHLLDINNPRLERSRANFDLTHMIKASGFYELPFGKGHRLRVSHLDRVIGGWSLGSSMVWQSGAPFSILSGYGTYNRATGGRSYYNGANTTLQGSALFNAVSFRMTGNGPLIVPPSAINTDGTGVNGPENAPFAGQIFYNPAPGTFGTLQKRMFDGPWTFGLDGSLMKKVRINDRQQVQLRMDAFNALNHPTYYVGDQNINSTTFGVIGSSFFGSRVMQFSLSYAF